MHNKCRFEVHPNLHLEAAVSFLAVHHIESVTQQVQPSLTGRMQQGAVVLHVIKQFVQGVIQYSGCSTLLEW